MGEITKGRTLRLPKLGLNTDFVLTLRMLIPSIQTVIEFSEGLPNVTEAQNRRGTNA